MAAYAEDLLARLAKQQHTLVLMIDQNKVNAAFEVLMVSVRLGKREVPLFWIVNILILSIALHWAVSLGLGHEKHSQDHAEKRGPKKVSRSQLSSFKW